MKFTYEMILQKIKKDNNAIDKLPKELKETLADVKTDDSLWKEYCKYPSKLSKYYC